MIRVYCYDLEVYKNFFSAAFIDTITGKKHIFYIYGDANNSINKVDGKYGTFHTYGNRDDSIALLNLVRGHWLVGFNNSQFDDLLMNFLAINIMMFKSIKHTNAELFRICHDLIHSNHYNNDEIKMLYEYSTPFRSLDLLAIGFNFSQRKSLKQVAICLKWPWIQDLPYPPSHIVKQCQIEEIIRYNFNDVGITNALRTYLKDEIKLRFDVSKTFKVNVFNKSRSELGSVILNKYYSEYTGLKVWEFKDGRTYRPKGFSLNDCINKNTQFNDDIKIDVYKGYKSGKKGSGTRKLILLDKGVTMKHFLARLRGMTIYNTSDVNFRIVMDDISFDIGSGGLHSVDNPSVFKSDKDILLRDDDATSYYPYGMINNEAVPKHVNKEVFLKIIQRLINERVDALNLDPSKAAALKITINAIFGKLGFEYYWLFDLLALLTVTINGQLDLLQFICKSKTHGFKPISANTDGVVTAIPRIRLEEFNVLCREWEKETNHTLGSTNYIKYIRRDVNNYISITDKKIKTKGCFSYEIDVTKGYDMPVVAKALYEYYVNGTPIETTIHNHDEVLDFCKSKQTGKDFRFEYHHVVGGKHTVNQLQKSLRYYVSNTGGGLFTRNIYDNKLSNQCKGNSVTIYNNHTKLDDASKYNINYTYYIIECRKIINSIKTGISSSNKNKVKKQLDQLNLFN